MLQDVLAMLTAKGISTGSWILKLLRPCCRLSLSSSKIDVVGGVITYHITAIYFILIAIKEIYFYYPDT
jgi:hypothetical protein